MRTRATGRRCVDPDERFAQLVAVDQAVFRRSCLQGIRRGDATVALIVPMENLDLRPHCGFASAAEGNPITAYEQRLKLERVVKKARKGWGN